MRQLLIELFNQDFSGSNVHRDFFARSLTLADLGKVCDAVCASHIELGGESIPGAMRIPASPLSSPNDKKPFAILAQLHGNEPAGLAGILLAMALSSAGKLTRDIIGVIGNPLAARQYFTAWAASPHARQETRDAYRCGLDEQGNLLPDMNRIPVDFMTRPPIDHHTKRAQELFTIGHHISGIADIHSARGNMLCITDHKHDAHLKDSPIRNILTGLAEAISAHASSAVAVQTFKTILGPLPNIDSQTGIEAGRHESPEAPHIAASFTLSLLHTLGITSVAPIYTGENGQFDAYHVQPRITYADLAHADMLHPDDQIYMAKSCHALASVPSRSDTVIVKRSDGVHVLQNIADFTKKPAGSMEFAIYQYDEMEPIAKDQIVAIAVPSGTAFSTKSAFSTLFISKSATLYDKDPSVGPWPVVAGNIGNVKFCYPCEVARIEMDFTQT